MSGVDRFVSTLGALAVATSLGCGHAESPTTPGAGPAVVPAASVEGTDAGTAGKGRGPGAPAEPPATDAETIVDLSPAILEEAIDREYYAGVLYDRVLADFGSVGPFALVDVAEDGHQGAVGELFVSRGWRVPPNPYRPDQMPSFSSVLEACKDAVSTEDDVAATYTRLLATRGLPKDVLNVFGHMLDATVEHHLPAFASCAGLASD